MPVGGGPTDAGGGLFAQQVQAQDELERHWSGVQRWLDDAHRPQAVIQLASTLLASPVQATDAHASPLRIDGRVSG